MPPNLHDLADLSKKTMKRLFDVVLSLSLLMVSLIPMAILSMLVKLTSKGPVLYWSERVGCGRLIFHMPKFRTMRIDTPELATHLLTDAHDWMTPIGRFLRSSSLDELPQLFSILLGDMSFVGPRPALFNQEDLIFLRDAQGIHRLLPGLTGWAQVNGRDELSIPEKVAADTYYLDHQSFLLDVKIIWLTLVKVFRREGIVQAGEERRAA